MTGENDDKKSYPNFFLACLPSHLKIRHVVHLVEIPKIVECPGTRVAEVEFFEWRFGRVLDGFRRVRLVFPGYSKEGVSFWKSYVGEVWSEKW